MIEVGSDVLTLAKGDRVSVPFNVACGYVDMGGWIGGQAEYVMVPYADFNLLKFPDRDRAMEKIRTAA